MQYLRISLVVVAMLAVGWPREAAARLTGFEGECSGCHHGGVEPMVNITADSSSVMPGQKVTLTIRISATNGPIGGIFLPRPDTGAFTATAGTKLWPDGGITHSTPAQASGNQVTFQVIWTAPTQPAMGGADFPVYAVSANANNSNQGDAMGSAFTSLAYGCGAGTKYYIDNDADGYGSLDLGWTLNCAPPPRYSAQQGDCNDNDNKVYPGASEICDGKDNNCDGAVDEGLDSIVLCEDKDGDGHGIMNGATHMGCAPNLKGFGACDGDCNDNDETVHPGATESCNNKDDNCDGRIDENARQTCGVGWCRRYGTSCTSNNCTPGQPIAERCNDFDDDCDGVVDNGTDLELCGAGFGCRAGYCVALDVDAGAGDPTGGNTTGGNAGGASAGHSFGTSLGCGVSARASREGWGAILLAPLGWAVRRRRRRCEVPLRLALGGRVALGPQWGRCRFDRKEYPRTPGPRW